MSITYESTWHESNIKKKKITLPPLHQLHLSNVENLPDAPESVALGSDFASPIPEA